MSYYKRMLRVFLGIAVLYTSLMEITFLGVHGESSKEEYDRTANAALSLQADFTDFRLQAAQETSLMLGTSEYTKKYLGESSAQNYNRLCLANFVSGIFGVTPAQKYAVAITKLSDNYVIMNNGTGSVDYFQLLFHLGNGQLDGVTNYFKENQNEFLCFLSTKSPEGKLMYILVQRRWMGYPSPLYIFTEFYEDQLFNWESLSDEGTFALLYKNQLVASVGKLPRAELAPLISSDSEDMCKGKISSIPGIRYLYFPPKRKVITPALLSIFAAGGAVLGVGILLMMLITRKMYTPIRNVLQTTGGNPDSGDEFAYIRETIASLHTDVDTMSQKCNIYLQNKCLHDLLLGLIPQDHIEENLQRFHLTKAGGPLVAVILKYRETAELESGFSHTMTADIRQKLDQVLTARFSPRGFFQIIDINFEMQALIVGINRTDALSEQLRNILLSLEPKYGLEIEAFVGSPCERLDEIASSYHQANKIADISEYLTPSAKVVTPKDVKTDLKETVSYPLNTEQALINGVIHCKTFVWQSAIDEIIKTNQNERNANISQLSLMLTSTVHRITSGLSHQNHSLSELFGKNAVMYLEFRSCRTYKELYQRSVEIFGTLEGWFKKEREKSNSGIADKMLDYVRQNYSRDISLFDLADYLNLSRNYVSTLFKSSTGRNFKDYLSEYRYKTACDILREHAEIKIKKVAQMVGCNSDALSRLFLRYAGMSPSDYQRLKAPDEMRPFSI